MTPGQSTGRLSVVPPAESLPDVLPTDRLREGARLRSDLRADLRGIPNLANALTVVSLWVQIAVVIGGAIWLHHPVVWVVAFLLMGRAFSQLLILGHEAAHLLLFSNRRINDFVGKWLLDYPGLVPFEIYRRGHLAQHVTGIGCLDHVGRVEPVRGQDELGPAPAVQVVAHCFAGSPGRLASSTSSTGMSSRTG